MANIDQTSITESLNKIVLVSVEKLKRTIADNIKQEGLNASGRTIASMQISQDATSVSLTARTAFSTLQYGRKPGKAPHNFQSIIEQWIIDKGIAVSPIAYKRRQSANWSPKYTPQERGLKTMAGAIAHTIVNKGTKLYRENRVLDIYDKANDETAKHLEKELSTYMQTTIQKLTQTNR